MFLTVRDVLSDGYIKSLSTYFANNAIYDRYEFVKDVYDSSNHRNAFVRRLYIFADRHEFRNEDVQDLLIKYGVVIMPLVVPTSCARYADEHTMSDLMLTVYSSVLVGLWKRAVAYIESCAAASTTASSSSPLSSPLPSSSRQETITKPYAPVELYVQKDCAALRDFRLRVSDRLYRLYDAQNRRMFVPMADSVVVNIERLGKRR